ncbi:MAG TPA: ABC transporter ATP-binding protein [Gaiellaceae bacterium]|nr:ABC transporter ATP-binding protein [Gaiellaceae bacterium]
MSDSGITLEDVSKRFDAVEAVRSVSLEIREGEFFSLLGPSGCGKTTTLRMIGGFEQPDEGRILLRGVDVTVVPPNRRNVNMVFQHYALFPHMSIGDNIAFGMRLKRVDKAERRARMSEMLRIVRLEGLEKRKPAQLSGGQQQRVALARALVNRPAALLLDEPLGALDVKLRKQMQLELKRIQSELGTTFVYVTHDQEEALAMSDRIAVMNDGVVEQVAPPRELYERPVTAFCADFIGSLNALEFRVDEVDGRQLVSYVSSTERLVVEAENGHRRGDELRLAVRPERIRIAPSGRPAPEEGSRLEGVVAEVIYLGSLTQFHVDTKLGRVVSYRMNDEVNPGVESGRDVVLTWPPHGSSVLAEPYSSG